MNKRRQRKRNRQREERASYLGQIAKSFEIPVEPRRLWRDLKRKHMAPKRMERIRARAEAAAKRLP